MPSSQPSFGAFRTVVAVPAKNEAEHIGACLRALALQAEVGADAIVLVINNTIDGTAGVVRALLPVLPVPVHVIEHDFPPEMASAGAARRMAIERGASMLADWGSAAAGVLLTTDADGRVRAGLDRRQSAPRSATERKPWLVAPELEPGRSDADPAESARGRRAGSAPTQRAARRDRLPWSIPDPCGSLAAPHRGFRREHHRDLLNAYRRAGGVHAAAARPRIGGFYRAACGGWTPRIRHDAGSARSWFPGGSRGAPPGGMADTMRRRLSAPDTYLDGTLEPAASHVRRATLRVRFRQAWRVNGLAPDALASALGLPLSMVVEAAAAMHHCGEAWAWLESGSPMLSSPSGFRPKRGARTRDSQTHPRSVSRRVELRRYSDA